MPWYDHRLHTPVWSASDSLAVVYTFPSLQPGYLVDVAVPHDDVMRIATAVALRAALAGIRLPGRSLVNRRRVSSLQTGPIPNPNVDPQF